MLASQAECWNTQRIQLETPMKHFLALALSTFLLAGCQHLSYSPAEGENTATVVFTSENIAVQPMVCVPGKGFKATEFAVSHQPYDSEFFTQLNETLKKQPQVTTTVPAGESIRLGFSYTEKDATDKGPGVKDRCKVAILFKPTAGDQYAAHFSLADGECAMSLTQADSPVADAVIAPWECP